MVEFIYNITGGIWRSFIFIQYLYICSCYNTPLSDIFSIHHLICQNSALELPNFVSMQQIQTFRLAIVIHCPITGLKIGKNCMLYTINLLVLHQPQTDLSSIQDKLACNFKFSTDNRHGSLKFRDLICSLTRPDSIPTRF